MLGKQKSSVGRIALGCLIVGALLALFVASNQRDEPPVAEASSSQLNMARTQGPFAPRSSQTPVFQLPEGHYFLYIIPGSEAQKHVPTARPGLEIYVTYVPGPSAGDPRTIYFLQAGHAPGTWGEAMKIIEK